MIAEAARMKKDAERMDPRVIAKETSITTQSVPVKRGRPTKAKTATANAS
jgi:hypothetical protein